MNALAAARRGTEGAHKAPLPRPGGTTSERTARLLSDVFQPALLGGYVLLVVALHSSGSLKEGLAWGFGSVALTVGLPSLDIYLRMRRSTVDDFHIYAREQRIRPLLVALACAAVAFGLSLAWGAPHAVQVCLLAGLVTGAVLTLVTGRWKISFHAAGAASSLVLLVWELGWTALVLIPLVPAIAWSRVRLERHTIAQVSAGLLTGLALTILVVALY